MKRFSAVGMVEILIALPLVFVLSVLAKEFVQMYGLVVVPVGAAVYFSIYMLVDKYFWQQSDQLEQILESKLSGAENKSRQRQEGC